MEHLSEGMINTDKDQHNKVLVLFKLSEKEDTHLGFSIIWILNNGYPKHPSTNEDMIYVGTYVIQ